MRVALRGRYIEFVIFMGVTERYPSWFQNEINENIVLDESRYTFWCPEDERRPDYYDKQLVEDYSVFLRKPNGDIHVTDYDIFQELYITFQFNSFTNSGIAALEEDCIEYVECMGGILQDGYPLWFYEYFTEALNYPKDDETIYFYDTDKHVLTASRDSVEVTVGGEVTVSEHCVFLRNKYGEIRGMSYKDFERYYDPNPTIGGETYEQL